MSSEFAERPPLQARSRDSWERVLRTALELFEDGGWDALSISEVCRRAQVSAPSIYARVDGRSGLFAAAYELGISRMRETEDAIFAPTSADRAHCASDSADRAVHIITALFAEHDRFLRAVIARSVDDPVLLDSGARESRRFLERLAAELGGERSFETARVLYSECVMRIMYGERFFAESESFEAYQERLIRIARALQR